MVTQQSCCRPGLGSPRASAVFFLIPFVCEHCFQIIFTELKKKKKFSGKHTQKCVRHTCRAPCTMGSEHTRVTLLSSRRKMEAAAPIPFLVGHCSPAPTSPLASWGASAYVEPYVDGLGPCTVSPQVRRLCCGAGASRGCS